MNIECCDYKNGQWLKVDSVWDCNKYGHIVKNLTPGHTYSFRVLDTSISSIPLPSLSSPLMTIPHETGSWQQDHLVRRYHRLNKIIGKLQYY